jgi:hypothetical protein
MQNLEQFTESLIEERRQALRHLEMRREHKRLSSADYFSCRASLLACIHELEGLQRKLQANPAESEECSCFVSNISRILE